MSLDRQQLKNNELPSASSSTWNGWSLAAIVATAVCVLFLGLSRSRLWDQDEGFFASAAFEMYQRNDWIVPTFNGKLFGHKPPLMYWGMMSGFNLFGVNEFAARIFSACFGLATAIATWRLGRRLFSETTGMLAGIIMASAMMFTVVARAATPDSHLTFFAVLAFCYWSRDVFPLSHETTTGGIRWQTWLAAYFAMGLGVLAKGPIGILFPMAVIGLFLLCVTPRRTVDTNAKTWQKLWANVERFGPLTFLGTTWKMRPLSAIAMLLVVAGPWYFLVDWQTNGEFLREFFGVHHFGRFTKSMDNHSGPWFYYLLSCGVGMLPWSIFAVPAGILWWRRLTKETSPAYIFVTCWAAVYIAIFSLARTKLPNYVLPAYPALALMIAHCLDTWIHDRQALSLFWMRCAQGTAIYIGALLLFGFPFIGNWQIAGQTILDRFQVVPELQQQTWWLGIAGIPLILGGIGMFLYSETKRETHAVAVMAIASVAALMVIWNDSVPRIDRFQSPQTIAANLRTSIADAPVQAYSRNFFRPSMIFYFGQTIRTLEEDQETIDTLTSSEKNYLFISGKDYERLKSRFPADVEVVDRRMKFPTRGELLVLARKATVTASRENAMRR